MRVNDDGIFAWVLGLSSIAIGGLAILYATNEPSAALGFYAFALFFAMVVRTTNR